jgi:hypothetical protein
MKIKKILHFIMIVAHMMAMGGEIKPLFNEILSSSQLPLEIHARIFSYMVGEKLRSTIIDGKIQESNVFSKIFENNKQSGVALCCYKFYCYNLSREIYNNMKTYEITKKYIKKKKFVWTEDFILKNINDFVSFDKFLCYAYQADAKGFNHKQLQSIHNILNKFPGNVTNPVSKGQLIFYEYCKPLTIENFMSLFHISQLRYLPSLLQIFFTFKVMQIDSHYMISLNQRRIGENKIQEFVNTMLKNKAAETGDSFWLSGVKPLQKIYNSLWKYFDWADYGVYGGNSVIGIYSLLHAAVADSFLDYHLIIQCFSFVVLGAGILFFHERWWDFCLGATSITGFYILVMSLINMVQMIKNRIYPVEDKVKIVDLSSLLKRTDIIIQ